MENLNYRFYILMVLGPMLAICSIRSLRYLSPCSVVANAVSLIQKIIYRSPALKNYTYLAFKDSFIT